MEVRELLSSYGYPGDDIPVVRGSALKALECDSADSPDAQCILELLNACDTYFPDPVRETDKPFLMPIEDVFSISGRGTVVTGRVERGIIKVGDKLLILSNGAYGDRMGNIAEYHGISYDMLAFDETEQVSVSYVDDYLSHNAEITHVAVVHCETTTGVLNPLKEIAHLVKMHGKKLIVDAMSSFGGVPLDVHELGIDFLISSANKCIQGVPGFGFIIARCSELLHCKGVSKSLSLDIYDQWEAMEKGHGKWRFTSPTHVVRAFKQAMDELAEEGGVEARHNRYCENHRVLVDGMRSLGFQTLLPDEIQSPVITSFLYPYADFNFKTFYTQLKERGFVIYPGKISQADTFRIGNIGDVHPEDFRQLIEIIRECKY